MKFWKLIVALLMLLAGPGCGGSGSRTPSASAPAGAAHPVARGLKKFKRSDFKREPALHVMTEAQLRKLPGYADAIDEAGNIRTTGRHVLAVVSPNAPGLAGATASTVIAPPLPSDGQNYHATSSLPLFGPGGVSVHDIHQGQTSDCYFLAPLAAMAHVQPQNVPLQIVREGPEQYRSRFRRGTDSWVRGDSSLPTNADSPYNGSNWAAIYEKAYAYFRSGANSYASLNWGYAGTVFSDLGYGYIQMTPGAATDAAVAAALAKGMPVCIMTNGSIPAGVPLIGSHAEAVMAFDGANYTIYNPWGFDGAGADANPWDGCVNVSIAQARSGGINCFVICNMYTPPAAFVPAVTPPAIPGDANGDGVVDFNDSLILSQHFGQTTPLGRAVGDFNGDGVVDFNDFLLLSQHFGQHQ